MLILDTTLTAKLDRWLRESRDDDAPELRVRQVGSDVEVNRQDGSEPTETEQLEIRARLAAHAVK